MSLNGKNGLAALLLIASTSGCQAATTNGATTNGATTPSSPTASPATSQAAVGAPKPAYVGAKFKAVTVDEKSVVQQFWVNPNAKEDGSGSKIAPFKTLQSAIDKAADKATKIWLMDGQYRTYTDVAPGKNVLVLQAVNPGKACITGADAATGLVKAAGASGKYSVAWKEPFPLAQVTFWPGFKPERDTVALRRELICVNDIRLKPRFTSNIHGTTNKSEDDTADPIPIADLKAGEFTVDDSKGKIFFAPPAGVDVTKAKIEVTKRGYLAGDYPNNAKPLFLVRDHSNFVMRGLVFQRSANTIKTGAAFLFRSEGQSEDKLASNVIIDNCDFRQNNANGMEISGARNIVVRNSRFDDNGCRGGGSYNTFNALWRDCSFTRNGWRYGVWLTGHDSAGFKAFDTFGSRDNTMLRCTFKDNDCSAYWQDYGGGYTTLKRCLFENNIYGINYEMTFGGLLVDECVLRDNRDASALIYGSPYVTFRNSYLLAPRPSTSEDKAQYVKNIYIVGDERVRDDNKQPSSTQHMTITGCTIVATLPETNNFYFVAYAPTNDKVWGKKPFMETVVSDNNRWFRRDTQSFPAPAYFPGTTQFSSGDNWKSTWPDFTWEQWRAYDNKKLDANSTWGDVDLTNVPDPTKLPTKTPLMKPAPTPSATPKATP